MNALVFAVWLWAMLRLAQARLVDAVGIAAIVILLPYNDWIITVFHPDPLAGLIRSARLQLDTDGRSLLIWC